MKQFQELLINSSNFNVPNFGSPFCKIAADSQKGICFNFLLILVGLSVLDDLR